MVSETTNLPTDEATPTSQPSAKPGRPPITGGRNLVVFCDGTSNRPDNPNLTNVARARFGIADKGENDVCQIPFYDAGVGTAGWRDKLTGGAFGHGLALNVEQAYRFLVKAYKPGDRIYLFGFSRGAYTARSVAGLIRQCSIIQMRHESQIHKGYKLYRNTKIKPDDQESLDFQKLYSHPMPMIEFIGVWDTVGALGVPANRVIELIKHQAYYRWFGRPEKKKEPSRPIRILSLPRNRHAFHDVTLSGRVKSAYHALAIDEHRPIFTASLWRNRPKTYRIGDAEYTQDVNQVWFAGDHSDLGGGNSHESNASLSLEWMATAAETAGLRFTPEFWAATRDKASPTGDISISPSGFWKHAGSELRDMSGNGSGTECIHRSADYRRNQPEEKYTPENLINSPLTVC